MTLRNLAARVCDGVRHCGIAALVLLVAASADATPVSLNFSGTIDLTLSGGSATTPFQGGVTWDPGTEAVLLSLSDTAKYSFSSATFILDSVDDSGNIVSPSLSGSYLQVDNQAGFDSLRLILTFSPTINFGFSNLFLLLTGPTSMFGSTALPADLNFLASVPTPNAIFVCDFLAAQCSGGLASSLVIDQPSGTSEVPEPASVVFLGTGLVGAGVRRYYRQKK